MFPLRLSHILLVYIPDFCAPYPTLFAPSPILLAPGLILLAPRPKLFTTSHTNDKISHTCVVSSANFSE